MGTYWELEFPVKEVPDFLIDRFRKLASEWHSGQWSSLYSFASTGKVVSGFTAEIADNIPDRAQEGRS